MAKNTFSVRPFDKLKKKISYAEAAIQQPVPSHQKKKEEYTDEELFSREMNDVLEIEAFRSLTCAHRKKKENVPGPARRDPEAEAVSELAEIADGRRPINLPDTQEYIAWTNPAYLDTIIPKLHEGQFATQAFIDLHGCVVPEAEEELDQFLHDCFKKGFRCVKIIHGRGLRSVRGPRVKDAVVRRLSGHFRRDVIAFVSSRQCDGGLGALYVLLGKK